LATILNLETSGLYCSVCIAVDGDVVASIIESQPNKHASLITLLIEECAKKADISLDQLDAIAICDGPGSFTGLRIGASTAKGLCYTLGIPLIAVGAFDIMAFSYAAGNKNMLIIPVIQARKDAFYYAVYNADKECIAMPKTCLISNVISEFQKMSKNAYTIFSNLNADISDCLDMFVSSNMIKPVDAAQMSQLSHKSYKKGEFREIIGYEPLYLSGFGKQF
jgi:tRNA threonylcarbamoyladenosine biosynthesis protein TsaB